MSIYGVSFDLVGKQPIVLLKTAEGNRYLPIWIGHPEAAAILMKLQGADAPRPLTHDLLVNILGELDVDVVRVTVTELRDNTFHASITVQQNGNEIEIDSRSSDAIAVAVRAHAPIFAADDVIEESAIEMEGDEVNEEEIVSEFRSFLEHVSAEDFAEVEAEPSEERESISISLPFCCTVIDAWKVLSRNSVTVTRTTSTSSSPRMFTSRSCVNGR
ncbi:MAG TPA: bifunctional nuclease family protein, partial [Gaiellaceae bacterium]|nr:bifunctional nuclease family protein [Gaiellaceae bacterium]